MGTNFKQAKSLLPPVDYTQCLSGLGAVAWPQLSFFSYLSVGEPVFMNGMQQINGAFCINFEEIVQAFLFFFKYMYTQALCKTRALVFACVMSTFAPSCLCRFCIVKMVNSTFFGFCHCYTSVPLFSH